MEEQEKRKKKGDKEGEVTRTGEGVRGEVEGKDDENQNQIRNENFAGVKKD